MLNSKRRRIYFDFRRHGIVTEQVVGSLGPDECLKFISAASLTASPFVIRRNALWMAQNAAGAKLSASGRYPALKPVI